MAEQDHILEANLVLTKKGSTALTPLSNKWWYPGGRGPASLSLDMVACARTKPQALSPIALGCPVITIIMTTTGVPGSCLGHTPQMASHSCSLDDGWS